MRKWIVFAGVIAGLLAFSALVWFAFPFIAIGDLAPFDSWIVRLSIILAAVLLVALIYGWRAWSAHRSARKIEQALVESEGKDDDSKVLSEKMAAAIEMLKRSTGKRDFLYELPWYIIIGPPGAGKTTALTRSGLKFYNADDPGGAAPVAGTAGTRYCDWWFTDEAVLIDTAGRYTTHDSDAQSDKKSWLSFLQLLKRFRPRQPVNGVVVAISLKDLITLSPAELAAHSAAIRRRLIEVHETLRIDFPVYMLFTKADLVQGFKEYFGNFTESRRRKVWGATFQTEDRKKNLVATVPAEFDLLVRRLMDEMPDRLQEEYDPEARIATFDFPAQFALLRPKVDEFLRQIFEPSRYQVSANLRGFYFSSGTQEGTPIDQVLGVMDQSFGGAQGARSMSGGGKSFFLYDLITKVILSETGWGTLDPRAVRRQRATRYATIGVLSLATVALLSGFAWSFVNNRTLVQQTDDFVAKYRVDAAPLLDARTVSDTDVRSVLDVLNELSTTNPVGYASRSAGTPVGETFGLSQRERLGVASDSAYRRALEQLLRSRLILRVEEQLQALQADPVASYEALKVYLMLGGKSDRTDPEYIVSWMRSDWEERYPGALYRLDREDLEGHLRAMLALDVGQEPTFVLNGETITAVQKRLAGLTIAQQAYAYLQSAAKDSGLPDVNVAQEIAPQSDLVFETTDGSDFNELTIPGLYTYSGFQNFFIPQLDAVAEHLLGEQWVRGEDGRQDTSEEQLAALGPQLLQLYSRDFIARWTAVLDTIKLKSLPGAAPDYDVLAILANTQTSPIKGLVTAVARETALTREPPDAAADAGAGSPADKLIAQAEARGTQLLNQKSKGLARIGIGFAQSGKRTGRPGEASADATLVPGADVEAAFADYAQLLAGPPSPVDGILSSLSQVHQNLTVAALNPSQAGAANEKVTEQVNYLYGNLSKFPGPMRRLLKEAADDLRADVADTSLAQLNEAYNSIGQECSTLVGNNYPFASKGSRQMPMGDFAKLFMPGGTLDAFFTSRLASMVDMTGKTWTWKQNDPLASQLDPNALLQFQRADEIKSAFFSLGTQMPQVRLVFTPISLNPHADGAVLDVEGTPVAVTAVGGVPVSVTWPGATPGQVSLTFTPDIPNRDSQRRFEGPWALYKFFQASRVRAGVGTMRVTAVVGGRDVGFNVQLETSANPFALEALDRFQCPSGL